MFQIVKSDSTGTALNESHVTHQAARAVALMAAEQRQEAAVKGVGAGAENGVHSMGPVGGGH